MSKCLGKRLRVLEHWICVICTVILFSGCASVSMQSVKDPSFSEPCHTLFVIINHVQLDTINPSFTSYLVAALKGEFAAKGVEIQIQVVSPLALDDKVYLPEIASYKPDGVLTIIANDAIVGAYGGAEQITYEYQPV